MNGWPKNVQGYSKAIAAAVTAFAGSFATAYASDGVSTPEWVGIGATVVVATVSVLFADNKSAEDGSASAE